MAIVALVLGTLTAVLAPLLSEGQVTNVALLYLFVTLAAAALWGLRLGLVTAVIADLLVNFFFIPPLHRFTVQRAEHAVTLFLFLAFAVVGAAMLSRFRAQVIRANARNAETDVLLEVSRQLAREPNTRVAMAFAGGQGMLHYPGGPPRSRRRDARLRVCGFSPAR